MKTFLLLLLTVALTPMSDQYHEADQAIMVYYSPKTTICLDFTYTEKTETAGEFAEYAEELLGITDAITESKTSYSFEGVEIRTRTSIDTERPHTIKAEKGMPWQLVNINERGLLIGYNVLPEVKKFSKGTATDAVKSKIQRTKVLPYTEETLTAKSEEERAQAVAKQILHLRETRMYLIGGEVENAPADGKAMELVLAELKKQEKQLVELFIGKTEVKTLHKEVCHCPAGENTKRWDEVLYFSEDNGFTGADNVDANRIRISAEFQHQIAKRSAAEPNKKKDKNAVEPSPIVYNLPGNAQVAVFYGNELVNSKVVPMAQFGMDVPLPKDLFTGKELPKIKVSERTGNVISIRK